MLGMIGVRAAVCRHQLRTGGWTLALHVVAQWHLSIAQTGAGMVRSARGVHLGVTTRAGSPRGSD